MPTSLDAFAGSSGGGLVTCEHSTEGGCDVDDGDGTYRRDRVREGKLRVRGILVGARASIPADRFAWGAPSAYSADDNHVQVAPLNAEAELWSGLTLPPQALIDSTATFNCLELQGDTCLIWDTEDLGTVDGPTGIRWSCNGG